MRVITAMFFLLLATSPCRARMPEHKTMTFVATGHSQKGETASGIKSQVGTVAADPKILPLGSRIRVSGAGHYSGEYTVADTGALVKGRRIDIYMRSGVEARKFGKHNVKVQLLPESGTERNADAH